MTDVTRDQEAHAVAERLLGFPLVLPLGPGEPEVGNDFTRLATEHAFGDSWARPGLDTRSRALISVTIAAVLGTHEPLRGQLRVAINNGVTREEIVELFIHIEAYAGSARAFDSYQIARAVFAEQEE
jgi:alkylhydroperoxidase/carboxymuconolactone decarboxylase family protein YurZ